MKNGWPKLGGVLGIVYCIAGFFLDLPRLERRRVATTASRRRSRTSSPAASPGSGWSSSARR